VFRSLRAIHHTRAVTDISIDELRERTNELLERVEADEDFVVRYEGRAVARRMPPSGRRRFLPAHEVLANQADPGLLAELREMLGNETTDDMKDPWERRDR
jgi:antitoxin (DNA-binding transcriptional repressor) of toxin-antitoxin stability system